MRIIISDLNEYPTYKFVRINQVNDFGAANTEAIQIIKIGGYNNDKPIFYVGTLYYDDQIKKWMPNKILSYETWDCREEAEKALMVNDYTLIDYDE